MQVELRLNSQAVSGNKSALVPRCVDGQMYGALPHCPRCSEGRLRVAYGAKFLHGGRGKYTAGLVFGSLWVIFITLSAIYLMHDIALF